MAIYHLHSSYGSRQGGQSARAELLYVLRRGPYARGRDQLLESGWGHLPEWCDGDPAPLFAASDLYERVNARLYQELEGALPVELDLDQCVDLIHAMTEEVTANGLPYAWGIHEGRPPAPGKPRNRHWHLVFLERVNDGIARDPAAWFRRANRRIPVAGGAPKDRTLKGHDWLPDMRGLYERLLNEGLERAGVPERVTAESHRTRMARAEADGDRETAEYLRQHPPGLHIGPRASAIERDRPHRPGRPTERGNRARGREAVAARLRAELKGVSTELEGLCRAAVAAARDAGVDDEIVAAAQHDDPNTVIALDDATEKRRQEIRVAALAVGFDDKVIEGVRCTAEPDNLDLGWAAVVEATAVRCERRDAVEAAARDVGVDMDAAYRQARDRGEDELDVLARETAECQRTVSAAWAALLDGDVIARIRREAESKRPGSEWVALAQATEERVKHKEETEAVAGRLGVDVDAVYTDAQENRNDPVAALERANAEREEEHRIRAAAREVLLDEETVDRIRREAETKEAGSQWAAVEEEIGKRQERKKRAEEVARGFGQRIIDLIYTNARQHGADPLFHLERTTGILQTARQAGLGGSALRDVYDRAEERQAGTGWTAISHATRGIIKRKQVVEEAARQEFVNIGAAYEEARRDRRDALTALKEATAAQREIRAEVEATARDAGVDVAAARRDARSANPVALLAELTDARLKERLRIVQRASGSKDRLDEAGWSTIPTSRGQARVLRGVERQLTQDFARRETELAADRDGDEWLGRARLDVLGADRQPKNLAERSDVLVAAEASRDRAVARREAERERRRKAEMEERSLKRIERQFAAPDGDLALIAAINQSTPDWSTKGVRASDVARALDIVEPRPGRSSPSNGLHRLIVDFEKAHPDASSQTLRRVGSAFSGSGHADRKAREVSHRLASRARVREIVAGRSEPPASAGLIRRLVEWLRTRVARLLPTLRRAAGPPPAETTARTSPAESPSGSAPRRPPTGPVRPEPPATGAGARTRAREERSRALALSVATIKVAQVVPRERPDPVYRPDFRCIAISDYRRSVIEPQLTPMAREAFARVMAQDDAGDPAQRAAAEIRLGSSDKSNRELVAEIEKAVQSVLGRFELRMDGGPDASSPQSRTPLPRTVPELSPGHKLSRE